MDNDAAFALPIVVTTIGKPLLLTAACYLEANVKKGGFPFNCVDHTDNNTLVIVYFTRKKAGYVPGGGGGGGSDACAMCKRISSMKAF